jgi:glycosyltransferase involved in cell wall biosynthesis
LWGLPNLERLHAVRAWRERFALVHTAALNPRNLAIAAYSKLRGMGGTRFLTTLNLQPDPGMGQRDWRCYRVAARLADAWCAVSEAVAVRPRGEFRGRFLGVIPNGFDPGYFDPSLVTDNDLPGGVADAGRFVLYLSALEPRKHPEFLVAMARANPDVRFVGAGWEHPFHAAAYLDAVRSLPNLRWLGHVDRRVTRALLGRAAVLAFPSEREGLPLTVIEALGMGVPVIAQPKSSLPELVRDGEEGRLIDIACLDEWQSAIRDCMAWDRERRASFAARTRARMCEEYSWEAVGRAYGPVYRKLSE